VTISPNSKAIAEALTVESELSLTGDSSLTPVEGSRLRLHTNGLLFPSPAKLKKRSLSRQTYTDCSRTPETRFRDNGIYSICQNIGSGGEPLELRGMAVKRQLPRDAESHALVASTSCRAFGFARNPAELPRNARV
jgi:hypothetical protein